MITVTKKSFSVHMGMWVLYEYRLCISKTILSYPSICTHPSFFFLDGFCNKMNFDIISKTVQLLWSRALSTIVCSAVEQMWNTNTLNQQVLGKVRPKVPSITLKILKSRSGQPAYTAVIKTLIPVHKPDTLFVRTTSQMKFHLEKTASLGSL